MIGEYRFFYDYFDGQIVKKESEKFKLFKLMLCSIVSALGLFLVLIKVCNIAEFVLLELGIIWNIYSGLNKRTSLVLSVLTGLLYFYFCINFKIYANALVYLACYIPLQLIATTKDYDEGDFVQLKKTMTDYNKILFIVFFVALILVLCLYDLNVGSRFYLIDGFVGALLICSALLRNERYFEYYIFRICALIGSLILWVLVVVEYGDVGAIAILIMYTTYLIYDIAKLVEQNKNYVNQYMLQVKKYEAETDKLLVKQKLKVYKKIKESNNKNN